MMDIPDFKYEQAKAEEAYRKEREKLEDAIKACISPELLRLLKAHFRVDEPVFHFRDSHGQDTPMSAETISLRAAWMDGRSDVIRFLEKIINKPKQS